MAEPIVTVITRQYVEISYTHPSGAKSQVTFPIEEVNDVVVQLAKLIPSDVGAAS